MSAEKLLLRTQEAAEILNIGRSAVYDLIRSGELRSVKIGGSRRIPRRAVDEYVETLMMEVA